MDIYSPFATVVWNTSIKVISLLPKYNEILKDDNALAFTAKYKKFHIIMFLLKKKAFINENYITNSLDIDKKDDRKTALYFVKKGWADIFKYLPKSRVNCNLKANKEKTLLEKFFKIKDIKLLKVLKGQIL